MNSAYILIAAFAVVLVAIQLINSLRNLNQRNAFKAKLYDKEMERKEDALVISSLDNDIKAYRHQLTKNSALITTLKRRITKVSKSFVLLNESYQRLKKAHKLSAMRERALSSHLAKANTQVRAIQKDTDQYQRPEHESSKKVMLLRKEVANA